MKKIVIFILVLLLLSGCTHSVEENANIHDEVISGEENLLQNDKTFEPDMEKLEYLSLVVYGVHWTGRTGEPWGAYKGFSDPTEISSEGLLNFFFNVANPDDYYVEETDTYSFSEDDICRVLSEYFTDFNFNAEECGKESSDGKFILGGFIGMDLPKEQRRIDEYDYDDVTGIITVKGSTMELDDNTVPSGNTFIMQILVDGESYLIKSFFYNAAEK